MQLQSLPDGQKELHLAQLNQSFLEESKRFQQARQMLEMLQKRIQQYSTAAPALSSHQQHPQQQPPQQ